MSDNPFELARLQVNPDKIEVAVCEAMYMLWQIEQESDNWLRFGGDQRITMDFIHDQAEAARVAFEAIGEAASVERGVSE